MWLLQNIFCILYWLLSPTGQGLVIVIGLIVAPPKSVASIASHWLDFITPYKPCRFPPKKVAPGPPLPQLTAVSPQTAL